MYLLIHFLNSSLQYNPWDLDWTLFINYHVLQVNDFLGLTFLFYPAILAHPQENGSPNPQENKSPNPIQLLVYGNKTRFLYVVGIHGGVEFESFHFQTTIREQLEVVHVCDYFQPLQLLKRHALMQLLSFLGRNKVVVHSPLSDFQPPAFLPFFPMKIFLALILIFNLFYLFQV